MKKRYCEDWLYEQACLFDVAGSASGMLCRAVLLGGSTGNSSRFNSHVPSCGLCRYFQKFQRKAVLGYEKLDNI